MAPRKITEGRGHRRVDQVLGHADAQRRGAGRIAQRRLRLLLQGEDPAGIGQQPFAGGRGHDRPRGPVDQGGADLFLQPRELLADGGLGHAQAVGGGGEALRVDDADEGTQQARI